MSAFITFKNSITNFTLPEKFTFPFYYEPHLLAKLAVAELQDYLIHQTDWQHNFGLDATKKGEAIGKMFGVLIVQNAKKEIGYLTAFSGKLANKNVLVNFVPPVYDILDISSFFTIENKQLKDISTAIELIENNEEFIQLKQIVATNHELVSKLLSVEKEKLKLRKKERKITKNSKNYNKKQLEAESLHDTFYFRELSIYYEDKFIKQQEELNVCQFELNRLKHSRNEKSNALHQKIITQYVFLNKDKKQKNLVEIFEELQLQIPAGTGDCAAPKLLQYAFQHDLKPIAMAEFWWGNSATKTIRKHGNFYPSCKGKCEPILSHMLSGMELDENVLRLNLAKEKQISIIYEDAFLAVINKPTELLSVPGKHITDSVFTRMKTKYSKATGPLLVHRLDMSTSGIMLIAKTKKAHQFLQRQFIKRTIQKRYIALLDGIIKENKGKINLPLRVDLEDRPKQLVCYDFGKKALTTWKVLERKEKQTKIQFSPITGRTHQLRVHAAHVLGLNTAIVGDDLYGKKDKRLYLHAAYIAFIHPKSKEIMTFYVEEEF